MWYSSLHWLCLSLSLFLFLLFGMFFSSITWFVFFFFIYENYSFSFSVFFSDVWTNKTEKKKLFSSKKRPRRVRIYFLMRTSKFLHIYTYIYIYIHSDLFFFFSARVFFLLCLVCWLISWDFFLPKYKKKNTTVTLKKFIAKFLSFYERKDI